MSAPRLIAGLLLGAGQGVLSAWLVRTHGGDRFLQGVAALLGGVIVGLVVYIRSRSE